MAEVEAVDYTADEGHADEIVDSTHGAEDAGGGRREEASEGEPRVQQGAPQGQQQPKAKRERGKKAKKGDSGAGSGGGGAGAGAGGGGGDGNRVAERERERDRERDRERERERDRDREGGKKRGREGGGREGRDERVRVPTWFPPTLHTWPPRFVPQPYVPQYLSGYVALAPPAPYYY